VTANFLAGVVVKLRFKQIVKEEPDFVEVAKTGEIEPGKMKSVDVKGVDVLIANVDGKFYALDDRCGHMNAMLSMGTLRGKIVVCPFHFAEFDVTTGQKIKDPQQESFGNLDKLPEDMQKFLIYAKKLVDPVRTYDMQTHEVKVVKDKIFTRL
jgi:nitrite reductase/ring-hydroxylating ferredoxin subunit